MQYLGYEVTTQEDNTGSGSGVSSGGDARANPMSPALQDCIPLQYFLLTQVLAGFGRRKESSNKP
jgi:hypothetical protein